MEVGLVVQLGHCMRDSCLNPADEQVIIVIDVDGVHEVHVDEPPGSVRSEFADFPC